MGRDNGARHPHVLRAPLARRKPHTPEKSSPCRRLIATGNAVAKRSEPYSPLSRWASGDKATIARLGLDFGCEVLPCSDRPGALSARLLQADVRLARAPKSSPNRNRREAAMKRPCPACPAVGPTQPGLFANSSPTSNCISDSWPDRALDLAILVAVRVPDEPGAFGHLARPRVVAVRPQPQLVDLVVSEDP